MLKTLQATAERTENGKALSALNGNGGNTQGLQRRKYSIVASRPWQVRLGASSVSCATRSVGCTTGFVIAQCACLSCAVSASLSRRAIGCSQSWTR
jgi:hypothetical protein